MIKIHQEAVDQERLSTNGGDVRNGDPCRRLHRNGEVTLLNILDSARGMIL